MNLYSNYVNYFKNLCVQHPELRHAEEKGEEVFLLRSWEEVAGKFRSTIRPKDYAFMLIEYTYSHMDNGAGHTWKSMQGAFIVLHYHNDRNVGEASFVEAKTKTQTVVDDFVNRMANDAVEYRELFGSNTFLRDKMDVRPMNNVGDGSYSGWLVSFELSPEFRCYFPHVDDAVWLD